MQTIIAPFINLLALLLILAFYLRKPLVDFVVARQFSIRHEVESARQALLDARQKFEDFSSRIKGMDSELAHLRAQAKADAEQSKVRILNSAKELSANLIADARVSAQALQAEFKFGLRRDLAAQALARAEGRLKERLTGEDHVRIRREFSTLVEKKS